MRTLLSLLVLVSLLTAFPVAAQDEESCDVAAVDALHHVTLDDWRIVAQQVLEDCPESVGVDIEFQVVTTQSVNMRDCAGQQCTQLGRTTAGEVMPVIAIQESDGRDWYQVRTSDGVEAWVAGWLTDTVRDFSDAPQLPLMREYIRENMQVDENGCYAGLMLGARGSGRNVFVTVEGVGDNALFPMLFLPTTNEHLESEMDRLEYTGGGTYILHGFRVSSWPTGVYGFEYEAFVGADVVQYQFEVEHDVTHRITIYCE